ncbi:hypothetical protein RSOLAG22IIIB_04066 [Rhizoctonia solani]|uniref:Arrestin-like N-terminal domain-containing protein n=1 Tax=Rhizoctonia solani TaxID=456999 RepID=A0A0K6FUS8_9AGAM|nr:hypothetical protein RSOLAG22IIIB_04066 [Rhizoctonia solani]
MAAPSYAESGDSAPTYSASLTDGERIPELQPSVSSPPTNLPDQYTFQSQRIKLDLGPRIWPVSTPCFGHRGMVDGVVSVTTLEHVKSITIKVEATAKAFFMQRGVPSGHVGSDLFQRSVTLYTNNIVSSTLETTLTCPFSINLPATCDKSTTPLPPSFIYSLPGASVEVRYRIRIDMSRSGLRRRESLVVPILYLPRSYTSPTPQSAPPYIDQAGLACEAQGMEEIRLAPKSSRKGIERDSSPSSDIQAKIVLPSPLVVASGDRIPFIITISSQSQALAALYTDISLQLVKRTTISSPHQTSVKEKTLAFGEVYNIEEMGNGVQVLRGELGNGAPGTELSWSAAGVVEVKHVIRLSLKPPPCRIALSTKLSAFERTIPIEVMTHRYTPDIDTALPALGLVGVNVG